MANSELSSVHQRSQQKLPPPLRAQPWLVYSNGKDSTFYNICDPINKSYTKYIPELSQRGFWQKPCHQGWLVVVCHGSDSSEDGDSSGAGDCFLWNPTSFETIQLPRIFGFVEFKYDVRDCVLSSPPQTSSGGMVEDGNGGTSSVNNSSTDDSMVYILLCSPRGKRMKNDILIYCHPGAKQWRRHDFDYNARNRPQKMLYIKDRLYAMCSHDHYEIEIQHGSDIGDEETLGISYFESTSERSKDEVVAGSIGRAVGKHWVVYLGEAFCIERCYATRGIYQNLITSIEIRKLDFSTLTWVEMKSLNDYVFFLSNRVQLCCLASELGLSKGCVFFTQNEEMSLYKYDPEDDSILLSLPCPDLKKSWLSPSWLMIPTTDRNFGNGGDVNKFILKAKESKTVTGDEDDEKGRLKKRDWLALLNEDLVRSVSNYLHTLDYICLRAVSKNYRSMLKLKRPSSTTTTIQPSDISPWLVLSRRDVFNFVNPMHNNDNYFMNYPEFLKGSRIRFSKGGWFLVSKDNTLFFYNPFSRSTIQLPDLIDLYHFSGISFSSAPTSSDCVVFAIDDYMNSYVDIYFIKRGDKCWTYQEFNHFPSLGKVEHLELVLSFNNPVFYHGAFYCLGINGTLGVSKLENNNVSWDILTNVPPPNCDFIFESFLVECGGKLLSVLLGHLGKWVRVFRLNDTEMVWEEVKNLGQHMLFLSKTSSISAIAPTGSQMENKIYFPRLHNEGILFYSLDTGMYHCTGNTHSAEDYRDSKESLHCSWIEPNWLKTADYRCLDWLSVEILLIDIIGDV